MARHLDRDAEHDFQMLLESRDLDEVVIAAEEIETLLEQDPFEVGESREEDKRILIHNGYAVLYRVESDELLVFINAFWRWAK